MESMPLSEVSDSTFDSTVLQSKEPVLVDFWAPWCGPCKALGPKIEELSKSYVGRVQFMKMNVDDNSQVASKYGIRGIPTLILFKDGKMLDQLVGNQPLPVIEEFVNKAL